MPTTIIFDAATLSDAVGKAARIAPTKGAAFDKAAGLHFNVDPARRTCLLRSTDLEVSYEQHVPVAEGKGSPTQWRIPSIVLADLVKNLPLGEGAAIEFIDRDDSAIRIRAGRNITKLNIYSAADYPDSIFAFDSNGMVQANDLAARVEQVSWACDPKSQVLSGIHLTGEELYGCNSAVLAIVPAVIPVKHPLTVPLKNVESLLRGATDCRIGAGEKRFYCQLDAETRATSALIAGKYPNVKAVLRDNFIGIAKISKTYFIDTLNRMMVLCRTEKLPALRMEFNGTGIVKTLTFDMDIPEVGRMQDTIDVSMEFDDMWEALFVPRHLQGAVENTRSDYFNFYFGSPDTSKSSISPIKITDDKGYECIVGPRRKG